MQKIKLYIYTHNEDRFVCIGAWAHLSQLQTPTFNTGYSRITEDRISQKSFFFLFLPHRLAITAKIGIPISKVISLMCGFFLIVKACA